MKAKCYSYIRFSTPEQLKGDSLRRQLKMSEEYAKQHGLELDPMRDLGLSAYKGAHRTKGALGRFLELVKAGKIAKDSILLVESLDRLSREQVADAFDQFRDIIKAGIRIVTLADNTEYTRESINTNFSQLIISLSIMSRANEESATKSRRGKANWEGKRERIHQQKLTSRAPEWLELSSDRTQFVVIKERAEIVRRIYEMKLTGMSADLIARHLNRDAANYPPGAFWMPDGKKGTANKIPGWRKSYITKILRTRAVIGEYQPHKFNTNPDDPNFGKREPVGDPIRDYFPAVVQEEVFYKVQAIYQRNQMHGYGSGQTGKVSNLFSHIAKCGYCGSSMEIVPKGPLPKGRTLFACEAAKREVACHKTSVYYAEFEQLVLKYCRGLNAADILPGNEEQEAALRVLRGYLMTVEGKLKRVEKEIESILDSIQNARSVDVRRVLDGRLENKLSEKRVLEAEAIVLQGDIKRQSVVQEEAAAQLQSIRDLFHFFEQAEGEELIAVRLKLREELRGLLERIDVYPLGQLTVPMDLTGQRVAEAQGDVTKLKELLAQDRVQELKSRAKKTHGKLREFKILFKSGSSRTIAPQAPHTLVSETDIEKGETYSYFPVGEGKVMTGRNTLLARK